MEATYKIIKKTGSKQPVISVGRFPTVLNVWKILGNFKRLQHKVKFVKNGTGWVRYGLEV